MQTFLPYADFQRSAQVLDYKRLGKQRVEALQLHNIVSGKRTTGGWLNPPAVRMWQGYADCLAHYHDVMIREWIARGYQNTMPYLATATTFDRPSWLGYEPLHLSHRSRLLQKDAEYYSTIFPCTTPSDLEYVWPHEVATDITRFNKKSLFG